VKFNIIFALGAILFLSMLSEVLRAQGQPGSIVLYEGNGCTQDIVCIFSSDTLQRWNLQRDTDCSNDEARSMLLRSGMSSNVQIVLADDPKGRSTDDFARVTTLHTLSNDVCVSSFHNSSTINGAVRVDATYMNGLDGKVSYIGIYP
jgi:hypothetical protein